MKLKKNPEKDLNLKRGLYFVIGLLLILLLIYIAFEWKSTDDDNGYDLGYQISFEVNCIRSKNSALYFIR